jgi:uncharacterized membrane protein
MSGESRGGQSRTVSDQDPDAQGGTPRWSDHQVELFIGRVLQFGVLLASAVVLAGGAMMLAHAGHTPVDFREFHGEPGLVSGLVAIVRGAFALDSRAVVQLGLVLLIATPVTRVALALVAFIVQRDRLYVGVSALVLMLLLYGLIWGKA